MLLLRQDPWCQPVLGPASERLADSQLPEWALRWVNVEDGFTFLMPFFYMCLVGAFLGLIHFLFLRPPHMTGFLGYLLPLAVVVNTSIYIICAALLWHIRGLVWRPHGAVTYADLSRAAAQVDHAELGSRPTSTESASGLTHGLLGGQPASSAGGTALQRPSMGGAARPQPVTQGADPDLALAIQRSLQDQGGSRGSAPDNTEAARAAPQQASTATVEAAPASSQESPVQAAPEAAHGTSSNSAAPASAEVDGAAPKDMPEEPEQEAKQQPMVEVGATPKTEAEHQDLAEPKLGPEETDAQNTGQAAPERIEILFRLPSGKRVKREFSASDVVASLYDFVETHAASEPEIRNGQQYRLISSHPRRVYTDKQVALLEAGLEHQLVLNVELH